MVSTSCRTGCRGIAGFLLQIEVSEIKIHKADEPNPLVGFDADALAGAHLD